MRANPPGLVKRKAELTLVGDALRGVRRGRAGLVVVEGEPGIGKTSLLAAARAEASGLGFRVLGARGGELERELPFRRRAPALRVDGGGGDGSGAPRAARRCGGAERGGLRRRPRQRRSRARREPARALLAVRQPQRGEAAAPRHRRRAVGRRPLAALRLLPRPTARKPFDRPRARRALRGQRRARRLRRRVGLPGAAARAAQRGGQRRAARGGAGTVR